MSDPFERLVRDHERIAAAVEAARGATEAAALYREDGRLIPTMLGELRALQRFMASELALHIEREERVVFPAFGALSGDARLIDELTVQHDRVRERRALLERALAALDDHHDEVEREHQRLTARLETVGATVSPEALQELLEGVRQLDWILQGHFTDEEDDLFAPGADLFTPADLERLATAMEELRPG